MKTEVADFDIAAAPRTPLPFARVIAAPGQRVELFAAPQILLRGPFWIGVRNAAALRIEGLRIGQMQSFASWGSVPAEFFAFEPDAPFPQHMVPIDAPSLVPGMQASLIVSNGGVATVEVEAVLWGTRPRVDDPLPMMLRLRPKVAVSRTGCDDPDWAVSRTGCDDPDCMVCRPEAGAAAAELSPAEAFREAERADTLKRLEPFDSEAWESPADES